MKRLIKLFFIPLFAVMLVSTGHVVRGTGYGYNLGSDEKCTLWWAEGTYKIMRYDVVPAGEIQPVKMFTAANEYESVQIVVFPRETIRNCNITAGDLTGKNGNIIPGANITIRQVQYLQVVWPTDEYGKPGWYPDPLPLLEDPVILEKDMNHPFFITVKIPAGTAAGNYTGSIHLLADDWDKEITVSVQVWDFELPERPSVRSSFGLGTEVIQAYHNLDTEQELREVTDKYYATMSDYKIAPTNPFSLYPMKLKVEGLSWTGGIFTDESVYSGNKSLKIVDDEIDSCIEAFTYSLIPVDPSQTYQLTWYVKTAIPDQKYSVLVKSYDADRQLLPFENRMDEFTGLDQWKSDTLRIRPFREEVKYVSVHLFPAFRNKSGAYTGTAWFDDIYLHSLEDQVNLVDQGDFEVDPEDLDISVDFTEFDMAGSKYLDELGFNAYHLPLEGMPSGSFYAQRRGVFNGFLQGTPEYDFLMKNYLTMVQDHLDMKGWLGRDYVYWFDEPNTENYPFVREGMEIIHRAAPKITRFITEHQPGPDIMDVTEISCTVIGQLDPEIIGDLVAEGREFWSYVCCCPKAPYLSLFIDHDAVNMRMWLWLTYKYQMKGILVWSANYWNSEAASPKGYLQNPWVDPMSYTVGYGLPYGKQNAWGNGDGRFLYPPNRNPNDHSKKYLDGPVPCLRLESIRDGIEDYEYLILLEKMVNGPQAGNAKQTRRARQLLALPESIVAGPIDYNKNPQSLIQYRKEIGELLDGFKWEK